MKKLFLVLTIILLAMPLFAQGEKVTFPVIFDEEGLTTPTNGCLTTSATPSGPEQFLFNDWQRSRWAEQLCDGDLANFTHKIPWGGGELLLTGYDLMNEAYDNADVAAIHGQFMQMQKAAREGAMDEYFDGFTASAKKKHDDWFRHETAANLTRDYVENSLTQQAVFVFDLEPVFVLYTRGGTHPTVMLNGTKGQSNIQVMYFVREGGGFKRTGGAMGSAFDKVFQGERFVDAASMDKPFSAWRINQKQ